MPKKAKKSEAIQDPNEVVDHGEDTYVSPVILEAMTGTKIEFNRDLVAEEA